MTKGPPRPLTPNRLLLCALINQAATPGLGSYMAGRRIVGALQLVFSVGGCLLITVWIFQTSYGVALEQMGEARVRAGDWLWNWGWISFGASWCWSLVSSFAMALEAHRLHRNAPGVLPKHYETGRFETGASVGKASIYKIIGADGQQYGPVTADQISRWIAEGRINGETVVLVTGSDGWKPLSTFPELVDELKPPLTSSTPPAIRALPQTASSKIPAGVCGILLGFLGIHKFILGYTGAGLIMLLATILTCGLAAPITYIIGFIEGIIYLCKSDEEFVRTYVTGRREWF